jgi:hypothetical protein
MVEAERVLYDKSQFAVIGSFLRLSGRRLIRNSGDQNFGCVVDAICNSLNNGVFESTLHLLLRLNETGARNHSVIRNYADSGYAKYISKKPLIVIIHEYVCKWITTHSVYFMG